MRLGLTIVLGIAGAILLLPADSAFAQGAPQLSAGITAQSGAPPIYVLDVRMTNRGTGAAHDVRVNSVTLRTLVGTGNVVVAPGFTSLPMLLDDLPAAAGTTLRLVVSVPPGVSRFSITENGTYRTSTDTALAYSMAQAVLVKPGERDASVARATASPSIGLAPLHAVLTATGPTVAGSLQARWDFDGDGTNDAVVADAADVETTFSEPGVYVASVVVTDGSGSTSSAAVPVRVLSRVEVQTVLNELFAAAKAALARRDVEAALQVFDPSLWDRLRPGLSADPIGVAASWGGISVVAADGGIVEAFVPVDDHGRQTALTLYFQPAQNGTWKVVEF